MITTTPPAELDLKRGLAAWAEQNKIRPSEFARAMGYKSQSYAWSLMRGQAIVTAEMLGRVVLAYGGSAADEIVSLAREAAQEARELVEHVS